MQLAKRIEDLENAIGLASDLVVFSSWDLDESDRVCFEYDGMRYEQPANAERDIWLSGVRSKIVPTVKRKTYIWLETI